MQGFGLTPDSLGPKPQPSCTSGIITGLLLTWSPPSTALARTQFSLVCKKWRKEGYSVVDTISFVGQEKAHPSEWLQHRSAPQIHCGLRLQPQEQLVPCFCCYRYVLNWTQQLFDNVLDMPLETFQSIVTGMVMRVRTPTQFQNSIQSAASAYTSCIAFLIWKGLRKENKKDGDPKPLVSSPGCSQMQQEDVPRRNTTHRIALLAGGAIEFFRT